MRRFDDFMEEIFWHFEHPNFRDLTVYNPETHDLVEKTEAKEKRIKEEKESLERQIKSYQNQIDILIKNKSDCEDKLKNL